MNDTRNVIDRFKGLSNETIIEDLRTNALNFSILCVNTEHSLNLSNIIRSANAFGVKEIILLGKRHWDRRGSVGAYKYLSFRYASTFNSLIPILKEYEKIVGIEIPGTTKLEEYEWNANESTLIIFGNESTGIPPEILERCDDVVEIPQIGSVRSLNLASAAAIVMYNYTSRAHKAHNV